MRFAHYVTSVQIMSSFHALRANNLVDQAQFPFHFEGHIVASLAPLFAQLPALQVHHYDHSKIWFHYAIQRLHQAQLDVVSMAS
ncbi:hypothetical protein D3C75_1274310 [compost metagenome]